MTLAAPSSESPGTRHESPSGTGDEPSLDALRNRLGQGDEAAFEQVFRRLSEPVFRFVCGMVQDEALAHDLTQDTFAKLWRIRDRMDEVDSLRAYVFQMARHRVYNQQRDEQVRREHQDEAEPLHDASAPPAPDRELEADQLRDALERWMSELPDRQREALSLRRQEQLSHDEIAEIMDIAPSTVNNHLTRAMKSLRSRIREHWPNLLS